MAMGLFALLVSFPLHAEVRGRFTGNAAVRGSTFVTNRNSIAGFSTLLENGQGKFNIADNGRMGIDGRTSSLVEIPLFLNIDGTVTNDVGVDVRQIDPVMANEVTTFVAQNHDNFNVRGRLRQRIADDTNTTGTINGVFTFDLDSYAPGAIVDQEMDPKNLDERRRFALATLNNFLNTISNSAKPIRVRKVKRDGTVTVDLSPYMSNQTLALLAQSDATSKCTGRLRLNTAINGVLGRAQEYYQAMGINGLNRQQIFDILGVEANNQRTLNNKILVDGPDAVVKIDEKTGERKLQPLSESGVSPSGYRMLKFLDQKNVRIRQNGKIYTPTCYESDDFTERTSNGNQSAADPIEVGIRYRQAGSEVLCHKKNGYMFSMLFDAEGGLVQDAPGNIAHGGLTTGRGGTITAGISCAECHAKGFLAGGYKVYQKGIYADKDKPYIDHFPEFKKRHGRTRTIFAVDGRTVSGADFFASNKTYDARKRRDSRIFWNALKKTGAYIAGKRLKDKTTGEFIKSDWENFPLPLISSALDKANQATSVEDRARELRLSVNEAAALTGLGSIDRKSFDKSYCLHTLAASQKRQRRSPVEDKASSKIHSGSRR